MKVVSLLYFLIFAQLLNAQNNLNDPVLGKASKSFGKILKRYSPKFSPFGNLYLIVSKFNNGKLNRGYLLVQEEEGRDSIELTKEDRMALEHDLSTIAGKKESTIIAPFIYIKDAKKLPTGQILYRDFILYDLTKTLYRITQSAVGCIVLPIEKSESYRVEAY